MAHHHSSHLHEEAEEKLREAAKESWAWTIAIIMGISLLSIIVTAAVKAFADGRGEIPLTLFGFVLTLLGIRQLVLLWLRRRIKLEYAKRMMLE